jgi:hypothetical protein
LSRHGGAAEVKTKQAPGLSDLNDEYPGACQPTLISVGLGPNGLFHRIKKQPHKRERRVTHKQNADVGAFFEAAQHDDDDDGSARRR